MATKKKSASSIIVLTSTASQKLAAILRAPQTPQRKESVAKSTGLYSYYREKWTKLNN